MAPDRRDSLLPRLISEGILVGISLLLALLMWLIASNRTEISMTVQIPVRPVNIPPNVEVNYEPATVQLELSLPVNLRDTVNSTNFEMPIDLSGLGQRAGIDRVETFEEDIVASDVQIVGEARQSHRRVNRLSVYPRSVSISARLITASFPLEAQVAGSPASGAHLEGTPQVRPARIWLTGPRAAVDQVRPLRALQTEPVDVAGLASGEHIFSPRVVLPEGLSVAGFSDTEGGVIQLAEGLSLPETQVRVRVAEDITERVLAGIEARPAFQRANLVLADWSPRRFTVRVSGPLSVVSRLSSADFTVGAADLSAVADRPMSVTVRAEPRWREGQTESVRRRVEILGVEPAEIEVTVAERAAPPAPVPQPVSPEAPPMRRMPLLNLPASP